MTITVTEEEIETILVSLDYSKQRVSDAQGTPYSVRRENVSRLEAIIAKLREARRASSSK